jgi:hypothetical protein
MENMLPSDAEMENALQELFARVDSVHPLALLEAFIVVDNNFNPGDRMINYTPGYELYEVIRFAELIRCFLMQLQKEEDRATLKMAVYCRVMEADLPFAIVWNMIRSVQGKTWSWTFSRTTNRGGEEVCRYPREKIREIEKEADSAGLAVGNVLKRIWDGDLRNMYSHSQYYISGGSASRTSSVSPISRTEHPVQPSEISLDYIDRIYQAAWCFISVLFHKCRDTESRFRDGKPHSISAGEVIWFVPGQRWVWAENFFKTMRDRGTGLGGDA